MRKIIQHSPIHYNSLKRRLTRKNKRVFKTEYIYFLRRHNRFFCELQLPVRLFPLTETPTDKYLHFNA